MYPLSYTIVCGWLPREIPAIHGDGTGSRIELADAVVERVEPDIPAGNDSMSCGIVPGGSANNFCCVCHRVEAQDLGSPLSVAYRLPSGPEVR